MEARPENSLLETVRPPRLEDAGLEDCALPPEAIKEAFLKAASSLGSVFSRDCVEDPGPSNGDLHDSLVGDERDIPCGGTALGERGELPEGCGGKVVGSGDVEGFSDRVLGVEVPQKGRGRACVDGLPEEIRKEEEEEEGFKREEKEEEEEVDEEDQPILAEACL